MLQADFHTAGSVCGTSLTHRPVRQTGIKQPKLFFWLYFPATFVSESSQRRQRSTQRVKSGVDTQFFADSHAHPSASVRGVFFTWSPGSPRSLEASATFFRFGRWFASRCFEWNMTKMASLILEDGTTFKGLLFGADVSVSGEVGKSKNAEWFCVITAPASPLSLTHTWPIAFPFSFL